MDWLIQSVKSKKILPESKYTFDDKSAQQTDTKTQKKGNGDTLDKSTDVKPKLKKRGASDDEESDSKKRVKDSQKASTKSLNIPIDEGFNKRDGFFKRKSTQRLSKAAMINHADTHEQNLPYSLIPRG